MTPRQRLLTTSARFGGITAALNALQDAGIVSDLVVTVRDVAESDCARAVAWLERPGALPSRLKGAE